MSHVSACLSVHSLFDGDAAGAVDVAADACVRLLQQGGDAGVQGQQVVRHLQQLVTPQLPADTVGESSQRSGQVRSQVRSRQNRGDHNRTSPPGDDRERSEQGRSGSAKVNVRKEVTK